MDLYLDSASLARLQPLLKTGLFRGVTTNPLVLQRAGVRPIDVAQLVRALLPLAEQVFVQTTTAREVGRIMREARELRAMGEQVVVKVAATRDGLTAVRQLTDDSIPTLVTAVYDVRQAVLARAAGARWVAPYLGRMTAAGLDGLGEIQRMLKALEGSETQLLVASIRSADLVGELAVRHIDAATVSPDIADDLFTESLTDRAVAEFDDAVASAQ